MSERTPDLDLGDGHTLTWPGNPRVGARVQHLTPQGEPCEGGILFDCEQTHRGWPSRTTWTVESWDPLT